MLLTQHRGGRLSRERPKCIPSTASNVALLVYFTRGLTVFMPSFPLYHHVFHPCSWIGHVILCSASIMLFYLWQNTFTISVIYFTLPSSIFNITSLLKKQFQTKLHVIIFHFKSILNHLPYGFIGLCILN